MDKNQVYREWLEATDSAILALAAWRAQLTDWQARGGEAQPGDFDANFQNLYNAGLGDTWADAVQAGGGIDVLATIVKGGNVCPTCDGKGKVRFSYLSEPCPTCGGMGALAAGERCTCSEPGAPATMAGDHAAWCVAVGGER